VLTIRYDEALRGEEDLAPGPGPELDLRVQHGQPIGNPTVLQEPLIVSGKVRYPQGSGLSELRIDPQAAEIPDAVLRQLGPLPVEIKGVDFSRQLAGLYQAMTAGAARRALGEATEATGRPDNCE